MKFNELFDFEVTSVVEIKKGFSVDKKFIINDKFLVRVITKDRIDRFKFVYESQKKFQVVALCQKVLDFVIGEESYYITEYIPGENGLDVIGNFTFKEQYDFGVQAASELVRFHKTYPVDTFDTKSYIDTYFASKVEIAKNMKVYKYLPEINELIEVVKSNLHVLYDLKGVLTHSDYHLFNMIFNNGEYMGVIDFERSRVSHFLTDFRNNTPHNSDVSPAFASGYIDGYLEGINVDNFFMMYNVHDLLICIAAIPWIIEFNPTNLEKDIAFIRSMFEDIKQVTNKPKWYIGTY